MLIADLQTALHVASRADHGPRRRPAILVVASSSREIEVRTALERGIEGYLMQDSGSEDIANAVRTLVAGGRHLCSTVAQRVADSLSFTPLTAREQDVLNLLAIGLPNKAIAQDLDVSVDTVKAHIRHILDKLGARSRTHALWVAARRGLVEQPSAGPQAPRVRRPATIETKTWRRPVSEAGVGLQLAP